MTFRNDSTASKYIITAYTLALVLCVFFLFPFVKAWYYVNDWFMFVAFIGIEIGLIAVAFAVQRFGLLEWEFSDRDKEAYCRHEWIQGVYEKVIPYQEIERFEIRLRTVDIRFKAMPIYHAYMFANNKRYLIKSWPKGDTEHHRYIKDLEALAASVSVPVSHRKPTQVAGSTA